MNRLDDLTTWLALRINQFITAFTYTFGVLLVLKLMGISIVIGN